MNDSTSKYQDMAYWTYLEYDLPVNINKPPNHDGVLLTRSVKDNRYWNTVWYPMDVPQRCLPIYAPTQEDRREKNLYDENSFSYDLNEEYFRCDDFEYLKNSPNPKLVVFGCSFTFGIGLPEEEIWPTVLAKKLSEQCGETVEIVNLSIPGGSHRHIDILSNYIDMFDPTYLCVLMPPEHRGIVIDDNGHLRSSYIHDDTNDPFSKLFVNYAVATPDTCMVESIIMEKKMKLIGRLMNAQTEVMRASKWLKYEHCGDTRVPYARDCGHPGRKWQALVADNFFKGLNNE